MRSVWQKFKLPIAIALILVLAAVVLALASPSYWKVIWSDSWRSTTEDAGPTKWLFAGLIFVVSLFAIHGYRGRQGLVTWLKEALLAGGITTYAAAIYFLLHFFNLAPARLDSRRVESLIAHSNSNSRLAFELAASQRSNVWLTAQNTETLANDDLARIDSSVQKLTDHQQQRDRIFMAAVATNTVRDAEIRAIAETPLAKPEIVANQPFDLAASDAALSAKMAQNEAKRWLANTDTTATLNRHFAKCAPVFDYIITNLLSSLASVASSKGDSLSANYEGLPAFITNGSAQVISRFDFTLQTNTAWQFQALVSTPVNSSMSLRVASGKPVKLNASVQYNPLNGLFISKLTSEGGELVYNTFQVADFRTNADELVTMTIAAQNKRCPLTNVVGGQPQSENR